MRSMIVLPLVAAFALSACGSGEVDADGDGKISEAEAASAAARVESPRPGQYKVTVTTIDFSAPGMPAAALEQLKAFMASDTEFSYCQAEEEAEQAVRNMTDNMGQDGCTYNTFTISGGDINVDMTCKTPAGETMNYKMSGTMSSAGMDLTSEIDSTMPQMPGGGGGSMHIKQHMKTERTGECTSA